MSVETCLLSREEVTLPVFFPSAPLWVAFGQYYLYFFSSLTQTNSDEGSSQNITVKEGCDSACECIFSRSSHVWLCNPIDCNPPVSSIHRIFQVRIWEWVAISSMGFSRTRDPTRISDICCIGRKIFFLPPGKPRIWFMGRRWSERQERLRGNTTLLHKTE